MRAVTIFALDVGLPCRVGELVEDRGPVVAGMVDQTGVEEGLVVAGLVDPLVVGGGVEADGVA